MGPPPRRATAHGTARYARAHPAAPGHYRSVRGLTVSSVGWGSYLGNVSPDANRRYEDAAVAALEGGINVVDTAINYRNQQSERDLGRALARFGQRDQVVVVTKGGFLPADAEVREDPRIYVRRTFLDSGILEPGDVAAGVHAMTPRYLADQLQRSLANLQLEAVDVYFIHNPETQLQAGVSRAHFEQRIQDAFAELERQADAGRLGVYGVATWDAFRVPPDAPHHLSLERLLDLAAQARADVGGPGTGHHFGAVELPLNLAMPEALVAPTQTWQGEAVPFVEAARDLELFVLGSASLMQGRLLGRLPPSVRETLHAEDDLAAAMQFARSAPGVTTALVGMGDPAHARANAEAMTRKAPAPEGVEALLAAGAQTPSKAA